MIGVGMGVSVGVDEGVSEGVGVVVGVTVSVAVRVGVAVSVTVEVMVTVAVRVGVLVVVLVAVLTAVGLRVEVELGVSVGVALAVGLMVLLAVGDGVVVAGPPEPAQAVSPPTMTRQSAYWSGAAVQRRTLRNEAAITARHGMPWARNLGPEWLASTMARRVAVFAPIPQAAAPRTAGFLDKLRSVPTIEFNILLDKERQHAVSVCRAGIRRGGGGTGVWCRLLGGRQ
jgi:hypothetical protein